MTIFCCWHGERDLILRSVQRTRLEGRAMVLQLSVGTFGKASAVLHLHNFVVPVLFGVAVLAASITGFVTVAPNRLVSGNPIGLFTAAAARFSVGIAVL